MNRKNFKIPPVDTLLPLDKDYKKRYNKTDTFLEMTHFGFSMALI